MIIIDFSHSGVTSGVKVCGPAS